MSNAQVQPGQRPRGDDFWLEPLVGHDGDKA